MTDIEQKALAMSIEVREDARMRLCPDPTLLFGNWEALCRAIEQHEAFRQEVSDACYTALEAMVSASMQPHERAVVADATISRFILPQPDPLVEAVQEVFNSPGALSAEQLAHHIRAALKARGLAIVAKEATHD